VLGGAFERLIVIVILVAVFLFFIVVIKHRSVLRDSR
jgi:hypothetical protein